MDSDFWNRPEVIRGQHYGIKSKEEFVKKIKRLFIWSLTFNN